MKRILFFAIFVNDFLFIFAQSPTDYNYRGDQELLKKDYQAARSWYSQGLDSCDRYSIQKLVEIWVDQPALRVSMQRPMRQCFECMKTIVETQEPNMMRLFSDFYKYGIGTQKNDSLYSYWYNKWWNIYRTTLDITPEKLNPLTNSATVKTPRKSLLSNRFYSFITYTWSPTMPFGFTAGIYDKAGVYVSLRTSTQSISTAYECNNKEVTVPVIGIDNPPYKFNRERWNSRMITGGLMYSVYKKNLFFSVGGGYGKRDYYREIVTDRTFSTGNKNEWCYNTEASYKGLTLEAGSMFVWKKLTVIGGVNLTRFKDSDIYLGIGLTF